MLAAVLVGPHRWRVDEVADPQPGPDELLLRTEISTICGSDVHVAGEAVEARPPGFPGHEALAVVVDSRSGAFAPGDRVLCVPPASTARCFAELQALPAGQAVAVPAGPAADTLVVAQQLGTAVYAMKRFWPAGSGSGCAAAVLGCGPAGLAFVTLLHRAGFDLVIASEPVPARRTAALRRGATVALDPLQEDVVAAALEHTGGAGPDLVVEAAGRDSSRHEAMRMVRLDGRIGLFGLEEQPGLSSYPLAEVFRRRPTIEMCWGAQFEPGLTSFRTAVEHVVADPEGTAQVSHHLPLTDIAAAFELARDPGAGAIKVALTIPAGRDR